MRIQYFSDLHLEFVKKFSFGSKIRPVTPVLVLAGDLGKPSSPLYWGLLEYVSQSFSKVFIITGNHEYYNGTNTMTQTDECIRKICQSFTNISFLSNSYEDYEGVRFIGSTLWSRVSKNTSLINDFYQIKGMTVSRYNELHDEAVAFLDEAIRQSKESKVVVVTHHLPSHSLVDPCYSRYRSYQDCFSTDVEHLIRPPVTCWIYGHTHKPYHGLFGEGGVQMCCNPIGYPKENCDINFEAVVEI